MPEVRVVTPDETVALRQRVLRPHQTIDEVLASGDDRPGIGVYENGVLVACASVRDEPMPGNPQPNDWRLRGMASAPDVRGQGYGAIALTAALDYAKTHGAQRVWCNARTPARGFYEKYGFAIAGDEFEIDGVGPHFVMWRRV